jgi:Ribonuclease G/E
MTARTVLIDPGVGAAQIEGARLEDLILEAPAGDTTPVPAEIWRAQVDRLVPKLGAAFVRLGAGRTGYLREAKGLRAGEMLLVQVVSYPEPGKASPVTRRVLHKSRTLILTPGAPGVNLSRRIRDEAERARLLSIAGSARLPEGAGLVFRTLAEGAARERIEADIAEVLAERALCAGAGEPGRLVALTAASIARRDWEGAIVEEAGGFEAHGMRDEIERLRTPDTALPGGAAMSVEATRALVAVDVNTGPAFSADAGIKADLAAARELPRQLRLRGLGGIVAVDMAPMAKKDRRRVEDALKGAFGRDPIETSLAGWTQLGLFELQRKRERRPLVELLRS